VAQRVITAWSQPLPSPKRVEQPSSVYARRPSAAVTLERPGVKGATSAEALWRESLRQIGKTGRARDCELYDEAADGALSLVLAALCSAAAAAAVWLCRAAAAPASLQLPVGFGGSINND